MPEKGPQKTAREERESQSHSRSPCRQLTVGVLGSRLLNAPPRLLSKDPEIIVTSRVSWLQSVQMLEHVELQGRNVATVSKGVAAAGRRV